MANQIHRSERVQNTEVSEVTAEAMPLIPMGRTDYQPENPEYDVRGYLMYGNDGQAMGRVVEILLDADQRSEDREAPLYHMQYAVVRYTSEAGTRQWVLVPMAEIKSINREERSVTVHDPANIACQEAYLFEAPDDLEVEGDQEVYAVWESLSRWERSGRGPRELVQRRR